ncbi:MAG: hypothetical protein MJZ13_09255 [Bacteroidales bacterium]|nr:hypothetical protein [Bacteroidales bacterium]
MKNKKLILLTATMAIAATSFGQKVSVDNKNVRVQYRQMAQEPLAESERTFTIIPTFHRKSENIKRMTDLRVEGLTYVNTEEAGLVVKVNFTGIKEREREIETITKKHKDKEGHETTVNSYCVRINYIYDLSYDVYDRSGQKIYQEYVHRSSPTQSDSYKSKEFKDYKEAEKYLRLNHGLILNNLETDIITNLLKNMERRFEYLYGYPTDTQKAKIQYLDSKKHPEYEANQKLLKDIINRLSFLTANGGVDEASASLQPSVDELNQILDRYPDPKDKNHIKMRFLAYYDLALIYAHTDRFGMAKDMLTKAIENDYETRECKKLKEWIEEQETLLKKSNMISLHFPVQDIENIDEANDAQWIRDIKAEEAEAARLAREAELNADEYLGEITVIPYSPTRLKVIIDIAHPQVRERPNAVKLAITEGFFMNYEAGYLHRIAMEDKSYAKCNIAPYQISADGTQITTIISGLEVNASYSIVAYTKWDGYVKYTRDCERMTASIENEEWVDLGLSVKWASTNLGAKKVNKLGNLYSWYDTKPYEEKDPVPHDIAFDKLPYSVAGDPKHDAATAYYGAGASIPTLAQWNELYTQCERRWIKIGRVRGEYFESPITRKGIFIPFTTFVSDSEPRGSNNLGVYWTSEKSTYKPEKEEEKGERTDYIRKYLIGSKMFDPQYTEYYSRSLYYSKLHIRAVKK